MVKEDPARSALPEIASTSPGRPKYSNDQQLPATGFEAKSTTATACKSGYRARSANDAGEAATWSLHPREYQRAWQLELARITLTVL